MSYLDIEWQIYLLIWWQLVGGKLGAYHLPNRSPCPLRLLFFFYQALEMYESHLQFCIINFNWAESSKPLNSKNYMACRCWKNKVVYCYQYSLDIESYSLAHSSAIHRFFISHHHLKFLITDNKQPMLLNHCMINKIVCAASIDQNSMFQRPKTQSV